MFSVFDVGALKEQFQDLLYMCVMSSDVVVSALRVTPGLTVCLGSTRGKLGSMHNVSTLKHNHMWAILKKHLSP